MQTNELRYEYLKNGVRITGYNDYPESLVIPSTIDDLPVLEISERAFCGCLTLKRITLSKGIKVIKPYAFADCENLVEVILPDTIIKIGVGVFDNTQIINDPKNYVAGKFYVGPYLIKCRNGKGRIPVNGCLGVADRAFEDCEDVTELVFFDTLKFIGDHAFSGVGISELRLPPSIRSIGDRAFTDCRNLERIELCEGIIYLGDGIFNDTPLDERNDLFIADDYLFRCRTNADKITIPDRIKLLADGAFENCKAKTIKLSDNVENLPEACFWNCENLQSVIAKGVKRVGDGAFAFCGNLKKASLSNNVEYGLDCFYKSSYTIDSPQSDKLKYTYIAKRLVKVTDSSFGEFKVEEGALEICKNAFLNNSRIVKIFLPDSVTTVGAKAFARCKNLLELKLPLYLKNINEGICEECRLLKKVVMPRNVSRIGKRAFSECEKLENIEINSAKRIDDEAFLNCKTSTFDKGLETAEYIGAKAFERCGIVFAVLNASKIGANSFAFCRNLRKVEINRPDVIPAQAFFACSAINSVSLGDRPVKIGAKAFYLCSFLNQIDLSRATLAESAFASCSRLTELTLSSRTIPKNAFTNCAKLSKVTLTDDVKVIEEQAFCNCNKLESVTFSAQLTKIGKEAFKNCKLKQVELLSGVSIGESAFESNDRLTSVTMRYDSGRVGSIAASAFENCGELTTVKLVDVNMISNKAFSDCSKLKQVDIGDKVKVIGERAFENDTELKSIILPKSLTRLGKRFLSGCTIRFDAFLKFLTNERGALLKLSGNTILCEDGKIVIPVFDDSCFDDESWSLKNLAAYDKFFGEYLEDKELKTPYVKSRLLYPFGLTKANKKKFADNYFYDICTQTIDKRDIKEISVFIKNRCFDKDNIKRAIDYSSKAQTVDITAALLAEYKRLQ